MQPIAEEALLHPEEMRGSFDLHMGKHISLSGEGRLTPAGIVTGGLMTVAILLATAAQAGLQPRPLAAAPAAAARSMRKTGARSNRRP